MDWADVCVDPTLQDLPYKVELDQWGQIVMSPASVRHVLLQNTIADLLKGVAGSGKTLLELPVQTEENVKVPDVAWLSPERYAEIKNSAVSPVAPEICVEMMSPGNTQTQMLHKRDLYFMAGAREFWLCDGEGRIQFFDSAGIIEESKIMHGFPGRVQLD